MSTVIAQRYAKAIFHLAKTDSMQAGWKKQLEQLVTLLETEEELRAMLLHPAVDISDKQAVLNRLAAKLGVAEPVQRLLSLLVQRHRLPAIRAISIAFSELADRARGRQPARVQTAHPLSDRETEKLQEKLERILEKRIDLRVEVNPDLIGGIVLQLGSLRYDGSIRGQLERFRAAAIGGS